MTEQLTLRSSLSLEEFDPLNIDVTEFEELAQSMPRDANLDIPIAEKLAVQYLRAADRCSEILSTLIWFEGKARINRNALKERLYLEAKDQGHKTVREREAYSESHESFVDAENTFNNAFTAKKNFEMRHKWFLNGHQYMKERLRGEYAHQRAAGFSETLGEDPPDGQKWGEKKW